MRLAMLLFLPILSDPCFSVPMGSMHYHGSYYPSYGDLGSLGPPVNYRTSDRHPANPTYQAGPPDLTPMLPTQYRTVWDIRDSLHQTSGTSSMIPSTDPISLYAPEGGYSVINDQSTGIYLTQPQVSPPAISGVVVLT